MKIFFRVDASNVIGTGHLIRCLNLANAFKESLLETKFIIRQCPKFYEKLLYQNNIKIIRLNKLNESEVENISADHNSWLGVTERDDAREVISKIEEPDLLIVDHYSLGDEWESLIKLKFSSVKLVVIDDLERKHNADLIIDSTFMRSKNEYIKSANYLLIGSEFAMLRDGFSKLHLKAKTAKSKTNYHKLIVNFGGYDEKGLTLSVLKSLKQRSQQIKTTVIIDKNNSSFDQIVNFINENSSWINLNEFVNDIENLMCLHTIAIGAAGSSAWERACLGIPSILIQTADNQKDVIKNLQSVGAIYQLDASEINNILNLKLDMLLSNFTKMKSINLSICDGRGCKRILNFIREIGWI